MPNPTAKRHKSINLTFDLFMDNKYYAASEYIVEINRLLDAKGCLSIQIDYRPANLYVGNKKTSAGEKK